MNWFKRLGYLAVGVVAAMFLASIYLLSEYFTAI